MTERPTDRMLAIDIHAEVIAALQWGPKMTTQLIDATGASEAAIARFLTALHASGVVRIAGEDERIGTGRRQRIWELQATPFALPDWNPRLHERPEPNDPESESSPA